MVINSVISLYYYVAIVREMFFVDLPGAGRLRVPAGVASVAALSALAVVAVGLFPDLFARFPSGATFP